MLVDDPAYEGLELSALLQLFPEDSQHTFVILADGPAMTGSEHPLLLIDLLNMDFEEFATAADPDGVFRGFRHG